MSMKMKLIFEELGIPERYLQETTREDRFIALVHKLWLKSLIKHLKLFDFIEKSCQEIWPPEEKTPLCWVRVFISVLKKKDCKVLPLPKTRTLKEEDSFLFPQFMQYIFQMNYINLWKDSYKKYCAVKPTGDIKVNLVEYNSVLRESIVRIYGCSLINVCDPELSIDSSDHYARHLNVFPTACAIETKSAIFLVHYPYLKHNLSDCVTFSPAILEKSQTKSLFIIYQLLNVLKALHERSLTLGEVQLNDFYITEDMWIYVFPRIDSNFHFVENLKFTPRCQRSIQECLKEGHIVNNDLKCDYCGVQIYDKVQVTDESLEQLCLLWIGGQISNFTYILHLNKFSGRVWGDPNCHYVFPWVTDFSSRCGKNWRDLKKSKYRLNKGDHQLDLTHDNCQSQVPHHVSDVLSSITYYVYMARRTPTSTLCKNVRTIWVPAEYPSSIQRIQEWTPDECIPEFYSDPSVFRSIHDDLDDLAVPPWASGPEDFIEKHREALESVYVSERIHHWIDLTFGYKLSGSASVKARNVCLNLVDDHEYLTKSGLVQLFSSPHPPKTMDSLYWVKTPPKVFVTKYPKQRSRRRSNSSFTQEANKFDDVQTTSGLSKFYSSSRSSLHEEQITKPTRSQSNQRNESNNMISPKLKSNETQDSNSEVVSLPKDYRPDTALEALEKKYTFFSKTFPSVLTGKACSESKKETEACGDDSQSLFLEDERQCFPDSRGRHLNSKKAQGESFDEPLVRNYAEIISSRRIRELKVLGCIIVEIFMAKQMRVLGTSLTLEKRLDNCLAVLKTSPLPPCVSYIVNLLLQPDASVSKNYTYPAITDIGLPPPSAHLLLEPLLHCIIPFSKHFQQLYGIFYNLKQFKNVAAELDILYHFECNGQMCSEYEPLEKTKILISQNIAECQVKTSIKNLEVLFDELNINTDFEVISILLPHIKELMGDAPTSVLAAWYLFEPLSSVLGPRKTSQYLLEPLLKLYENDPNDVHLPYMGKIAKLYHHSFLLCLMVRLGMKCFLENFVVPLVESVGGYKDCELVEFVLHNHSEKNVRKTSHLKTIDSEQMDVSGSDDSTSSDKQELPTEKAAKDEEIFEFEEEKNNEDQMKFLIEHLQLNVSSELPSGSSNVEEGLDANLTDDLNNSEEANPQVANDIDSHAFLKSPTIPIPSSYHNNLANISCEVGSKSDETHSSNSKFESQKVVHRPKHKISEMSSESLIWLAHRLGPLLTARYLSRNLLKMLALCYMGRDNLVGHNYEDIAECNEVSIGSGCVVGDIAAVKVLGCLTSISGLYGEQIIIIQYIPHMTELILLCKKRITPNLEGGLISCLALLKQIIPYLSDMMLMDQLQDVLLKNIINPVVKILGSTKHVFPCGGCARNILARKYLDAIYILSIRIGTDMTKKYLMAPALQRFFSIFDSFEVSCPESAKEVEQPDQSVASERHTLVQRSPVRLKQLRSPLPGVSHEDDGVVNRALEELKEVFTPELAHAAYLPFVKLLGCGAMEISLSNHDRIRCLCQEYEESIKASHPNSVPRFTLSDFTINMTSVKSSGSIGSNVAVVGNRIDVQPELIDSMNVDLLSLVSYRTENGARHLRGNWLAYWENEIGRSDANNLLNFKQIKLQTFAGHSQSVKCLHTLDNENSFLSGSRDKTIKLWSLRSQGDGFAISNCQWTYSGHKKSILSITFVESARLVASCDSVVHVWDPFMGANLANLESPKFAPVNALKSAPAPSTLVFASTTDGTLKILDARTLNYVQELKTSVNPFGLIRCLAVAPSGLWVAAGQSSGNITVLDTRTGLILSNWRAHESEVLQLVAHNDDTVISTSLDQITSVWNISDGKFKFFMKGTTEPVHCLSIHNHELISGTTANRIGVHASIAPDAAFSNNKLRSDTFKGLLTSMDYLPLNKLLLLGADTGNINLLC